MGWKIEVFVNLMVVERVLRVSLVRWKWVIGTLNWWGIGKKQSWKWEGTLKGLRT